MFRYMTKAAYEQADRIISITRFNTRYQLRYGADPDKLDVIPNGIDVAKLTRIQRDTTRRDQFSVGLVGRVVPIKDIKTFIRAIKVASMSIPTIKGYIIGPTEEDPEYFAECQQIVDMLQVGQYIEFTGQVNVADYYAFLDVMVLTSLSEGQPLVILEGHCVGIPVVATDVGACRELLTGANTEDAALGPSGLLTPADSPSETANALIRLWRNPHLRAQMGQAGRERTLRYYRQETLQMILTRYLADRLYAADVAKIAPPCTGMLAAMLPLALLTTPVVFFAPFSLTYRLLGRISGVTGSLAGFLVGQVMCLALLIARVYREFAPITGLNIAFLRYLGKYWDLGCIGLLYAIGIWGDNIVFWWVGNSVMVGGFFHLNPIYDSTKLIAYLATIPASASFLVHLESNFYRHYRDYFNYIREKGTLAQITAQKDGMREAAQSGLVRIGLIQGGIGAAVYALAPNLALALNENAVWVRTLRMLTVGVSLQIIMLSVLILLLYQPGVHHPTRLHLPGTARDGWQHLTADRRCARQRAGRHPHLC
jgi:hypothetical protein